MSDIAIKPAYDGMEGRLMKFSLWAIFKELDGLENL